MTTQYDRAHGTSANAQPGFPLHWPLALLANLLPTRCDTGKLTIRLPAGQTIVCASTMPGPRAQVDVKHWRGFRRMLLGGNVGFAQAFIDGDCECADLNELFSWVLANDRVWARFGSGSALLRWAGRQYHWTKANTRQGSRRNIAAHYDLGNAFYQAWLDAGMNYSSAMFGDNTERSLESAQAAKLDRIVELMDIVGGERVLEIGCGWGALAERLAQGPAAHVTAVTLSKRQLEYAQARITGGCATDRAEIRLQDYRDVGGTYDRIVSIEMLEAVGQCYWPVYFDTLRHRLAPGGIAVLQVITIRSDRFAAYAREPDFIQRYIFPGGVLPTVPILQEQIKGAGLALTSMETFGACYERTLTAWRHRFQAAWPQLSQMGFDERFRRMWTYYLSYCEAGFSAGELDVGLYRIEHPKD
jgi:cyclopropane-fatty-acyl-phospholipid synthase